MKHFKSVYLVLLITIASCSTKKNTAIYWVDSAKRQCYVDTSKPKCLLVHKGALLVKPNWVKQKEPISGFEFEEGYIQKVKIKEEIIKGNKSSSGISSKKYSLVKILEKKRDEKLLLNGKWSLLNLRGVKVRRGIAPTLEINLSNNSLNGSDGCNLYTSTLKNASASRIEIGNIARTKKMCMDNSVAAEYIRALRVASFYKFENNNLLLLGNNKEVVLEFKKKVKKEEKQEVSVVWAVVSIAGDSLDSKSVVPMFEINKQQMMVLGFDGCAPLEISINEINERVLKLGSIPEGIPHCESVKISTDFKNALDKVHSFLIEDSKLILKDKEGKELILLKRKD